MNVKRRAYTSRNWKISTPYDTVTLFWQITHSHRNYLNEILDMGARDGRLAKGGNYKKYEGVEIEKRISSSWKTSKRRNYFTGCVFKHKNSNYSACIANPPYLRHNEISVTWRERILASFKRKLDVKLDLRSNLYLYFILLGLQKTKKDGIVSMIVPYEWSFIPSGIPLRKYIEKNKWDVHIYRLKYSVFQNVQTTASISIIDKSKSSGKWKYYDVDEKSKIEQVPSFTDSDDLLLKHENRGRIWAMRGLSPGTKKIFTLTEKERIESGLTRKDVRPCITTLREIPVKIKILNLKSFNKYFVSINKKCWLIRTDKKLTHSLQNYVQSIPKINRSTWTCLNQKPWYKYKPHPTPNLLFGSAFKQSRPRILLNNINAVAYGSVLGIHTPSKMKNRVLHKGLLSFDFKSKILSRENGLKKIAVKQLNTVLNQLEK